MKIQNSKFKIQNHLGFTLIELLVAVTIIGVLTVLGTLSYQKTNQKARDGRRKADLEQIRTALEIYRTDTSDSTYAIDLVDLVPDYMQTAAADPKGFVYYYVPAGNLRSYSLCAHLEADADTDSYCGQGNNCGGTCNYRVTNP